jgi:hypothetical protein
LYPQTREQEDTKKKREKAEKRKAEVSEIARVLLGQKSANDQEKSEGVKNLEKKSGRQKIPEKLKILEEREDEQGDEDITAPQQVRMLDEALESMSVEEFVEIKKKRGRPTNGEKAMRDGLAVDHKSTSKKKGGANEQLSK